MEQVEYFLQNVTSPLLENIINLLDHKNLKKAGYGFKIVMYKNVCSPPSAKEPKSQLNAEQPSKGRCWNPPKEAAYV